MNLEQTKIFSKQKKKLHPNQIQDLDNAVKTLLKNPDLGETKKSDLRGVKIFKFKMQKQEALLAYELKHKTILLLALGSHENFYRDLKKKLK